MGKEDIITLDDFDEESTRKGKDFSFQEEGLEELTDYNKESEHNEFNINIIRQRTFNKELRELLAKIRSNESQRNDKAINMDEISEEELIKRFHILFYRSVNLIGLSDINSNLNPYLLPNYFFKDNLEQNILYEMQNLSLPEYAILSYNLEKKCYIPVYCYIDDIIEDNIAIDICEELYTQILDSKYGIILNYQSINNNIFLKKRFSSNCQNDSQYLLYFVSFKNIFSNLLSEMNLIGIENIRNIHLSQILMIRIKDGMGENIVESIYNKIIDKLIIHFLLLEKRVFGQILKVDYENIYSLFNILEFFIRIFSKFYDGVGYIIKCKNYFKKENLFIFQYLLLKFKNTLSAKSIISQLANDKFLILTKESEGEIVEQIVKEFNNYNNNILRIKAFNSIANNNHNSLLNECLS